MSLEIKSDSHVEISDKHFYDHQHSTKDFLKADQDLIETMDNLNLSQDNDSDMSFTEFCDEFCPEGEVESEPFVVLSSNDVVDLMKTETKKVCEIVNLPPAQLRMLLTTHKWDTDKFLEKFFDGSVKLPETALGSSRKTDEYPKTKKSKTTKKECDICAENCKIKNIRELNCDHFFCNECLKTYIKTAVVEGNLVDCVKCPGYACEMPFEDDFIVDLLPTKLKPKYQQLITSGFVANNRLIKWCQAPDCSNAIKVDVAAEDRPAVICKCGYHFCFACNTEIHDMIPCKLVQEFKEVKAETLKTSNWVVRFTKPCPKCKTDIEKNGGCNHIVCRQCKHEFCWVCSKEFRNYAAHNCVPLEASRLKNTDMRRLANYDTKLQIMKQSIKLDQTMYKSSLQQQRENVQEQWFRIDFMVEAVELLLSCRRTLADSYIFFYFYEIPDKIPSEGEVLENTPNEVQWHLFERNHAELSAATENLSFKLETIVDGDNFHEMKREIRDHTCICKGFQRAVTMQVADGFANNVWEKRPDSI